ncbi:uncharacterized protein LOC133147084 isoform X5 [Syngnathus typhle]|uniref:uncharacterized protein LOC133147084 isoform X5 n=1 Tax=Syngnathus typhle TaxID=161592 RepID=UPI002A69FEEC|nr:uncharacterized protein LOC133147084 isoform X5 [Syngnathus typhle]
MVLFTWCMLFNKEQMADKDRCHDSSPVTSMCHCFVRLCAHVRGSCVLLPCLVPSFARLPWFLFASPLPSCVPSINVTAFTCLVFCALYLSPVCPLFIVGSLLVDCCMQSLLSRSRHHVFLFHVLSGFYPSAQNVTWKSTNFKTILTWEPLPTDYSYTVEFSVVAKDKQRNSNCIRISTTMCDLTSSLTDLNACYVADVLSEPPLGVTSDLTEFPYTSSSRFCPANDMTHGPVQSLTPLIYAIKKAAQSRTGEHISLTVQRVQVRLQLCPPCVEFTCSPRACVGILQAHPKNMHGKLIEHSKLPGDVSVSADGCSSQLDGNQFRVSPAYNPMTAGIGSSTLATPIGTSSIENGGWMAIKQS